MHHKDQEIMRQQEFSRRLFMHRSTVAIVILLAIPCLARSSRAGDNNRIAIEIIEPPERQATIANFPASVGLVFLEGELPSADGGALLDDRGEAVPFESEATGWWSPEKRSV